MWCSITSASPLAGIIELTFTLCLDLRSCVVVASSRSASSNKPQFLSTRDLDPQQYQRLVLDLLSLHKFFLDIDARNTHTRQKLPNVPSPSATSSPAPWVPLSDLATCTTPARSQPERYVQGASGAERSNTPLRTSRTGGILYPHPRFTYWRS